MSRMNYDENDVAALKQSNILSGLRDQGIRFDGADDGSIFFARELDYVKTKTYDKQYPQMTGLKLVPVSHEVNPGADSITYYSYDKTGFAAIISNYSTDLPRADVKGKPHTSNVVSVGDSYGYSMQDMRASKMANKHLDTRRGESARYQIDRKINELVFKGDDENNLVGLFSKDNNIPVYSLAPSKADPDSTSWDKKDADEIVADIIGMVSFQADTTMDVEKPNYVALPPSSVRTLTAKRLDGTDKNAFTYLKENLSDIKTWYECPELEARSVSTNPFGKKVVLIGNDSSEKATFEIPLAFYQYAAQPKNLEIQVPCESRVGGLVLYYPMAFTYAVGI